MRPASTARRLGLCTLAVIVCFGALAFRVTQLQVLSGDRYHSMALDQRLRTVPLTAMRGSIYDRNGRDLALSIQRSSIYADPKLVTDPAMYASKLAPVVGVDANVLIARLGDRTRRFVYVARTVEDGVADQVRALALPGVGFVPEPLRQYPANTVAAAVVGRVGAEGTGLDGLEALYEDELAGTAGEIVVERDQRGREIPDTQRRKTDAIAGTDLVLTIDQNLQYDVERTLADQITATGATRGLSIVVDIPTGDVLAMATVHGPDADGPARPAIAGEVNAALVDVFQPGSTMKAVTISQAIDLGLVGPQTPFEVPSELMYGDHPYTDHDRINGMERWSTADILRESSNVGTIMIADTMTHEQLDAGIRKFGFGQKTTIDFPAQPNGFVIPVDRYYATDFASSAIGTAEGVTAMQMVDVYSTLGNSGVAVNPRVVGATIDADGTRHENKVPAGKRVVSDATATVMNTMMRDVVRSGTGTCAAIEGYSIAGKTGTAQQALPTGGWSDTTFASFAGFAPAENPRFAAIVVLDAPQTSQFGARAAAPAWAEIMRAALMQYRVAPTDTGSDSQFAAAQAKANATKMNCSVPHGDALQQVLADRATAAAAAAAAAQTATDPAAGAATEGEGTAPTTLPADTSPSE